MLLMTEKLNHRCYVLYETKELTTITKMDITIINVLIFIISIDIITITIELNLTSYVLYVTKKLLTIKKIILKLLKFLFLSSVLPLLQLPLN